MHEPASPVTFVCDAHMGGLARYLRMLGVDALYRADFDDDELVAIAGATGRVLLSKDRGLLARLPPGLAYGVRELRPRAQLAEVVARFGLASQAAPLTRCLACNTPLVDLALPEAEGRAPPGVGPLKTCPTCERIYWEGSHHRKMRAFTDSVLAGGPGG